MKGKSNRRNPIVTMIHVVWKKEDGSIKTSKGFYKYL